MLRASLDCRRVAVSGLMTIAPFARPESVRWVFRDLHDLFESLSAMRFNGVELTELSMGMTNDFGVAIEEGATIVRIGTGDLRPVVRSRMRGEERTVGFCHDIKARLGLGDDEYDEYDEYDEDERRRPTAPTMPAQSRTTRSRSRSVA